MARVFDCFPFFNELDLLEIRLNELSGVVDRFVIAEASVTFSGRPKPLVFAENRARFAAFADRIVHVVVDDAGAPAMTGWDRRALQCNALAEGFRGAAPEDLVIVSDVDEIVSAKAVAALRAAPPGPHEVVCFELRMFNYFVNLELARPWLRSGPRAARVSAIGAVENLRKVRGPSPSPTRDLFRSLRAWRLMGAPVHRRVLYDAGWHFTYLGGVDAIIEKLQSCAGHDAVAPDVLDRDRLAARIRAGVPISAEGQGMATVRPLDDGFPAYLVQHREKFRHLIAEPARLPAVA